MNRRPIDPELAELEAMEHERHERVYAAAHAHEEAAEPGWNGFTAAAWEQDSRAVIACNGKGNGAVLWTVGPHIRFEMDEGGLTGLDDLGLDDAPAGVSVWVGRYVATGGYPDDGSSDPEGAFRPPTDDEWIAIREGRCPWAEENQAALPAAPEVSP
jgi:hypothetical protein